MARSFNVIGPGNAPAPVGNPGSSFNAPDPFGFGQGPRGFTAVQRAANEFQMPGGGLSNFMSFLEGLHGVGSGAVGRSNFNLNKSTQLRDIALQRQELERQQSAGLRDIEQGRTEGIRAAINNALQRGIFNSGIRQRNEQRVERESDEAAGDLQGRIQIALDRLANRRRGVSGQKFSGGSSGGTADISAIIEAIAGLAG